MVHLKLIFGILQNIISDIIREKVTYKKDIKVKRIVNEYLKNSDDILVKILKHPTVTNAKIIDGEIKIDVDFEILAEVIGETKMQVTVFTPVAIDEDIEDLDIEVNEDFLRQLWLSFTFAMIVL